MRAGFISDDIEEKKNRKRLKNPNRFEDESNT